MVADQREADAHFAPIMAARQEKEKLRWRKSKADARERKKRESGRCNSDTSSAVSKDNETNKRKDELS